MHKNFYSFVALLLGFVFFTGNLSAQNTTAALTGVISSQAKENLPGATVIAVHTPSGTRYGTTTLVDGQFTIRGMRVGGPYQVSVSFVGYHAQQVDNLFLKLGESQKLNIALSESTVNLEGVEIVANANADINGERTGAATSISSEQLKGLPTISRSAADFTRLTPQSDGNSFGGRNNLYNNFSLDGSVFNNSFGLDVATPGGQAGAQPVSLDALEQVQVSLAPFDVREGGFTGAGVNAVTKSGTNEFHGTAYMFGRNQDMIGSRVSGTEIPNLDYKNYQAGVSLGGAIVKNKLFFFVNGEIEQATELAHGFRARREGEQVGGNITSVDFDAASAVKNHLMNEWGYDAGEFEGYNHQKENRKLLAKLDWNINDDQNFSLRYNSLRAWKDILPHPEAIGGRGATPYRLPFSSSSYTINNNIDSWMAELNSRFGNVASNKLQAGYSKFRDYRAPWSEPFPVIDILNESGQVAMTTGSEMFSTNNMLDQDIFQFRDDLTVYLDKHTVTMGINVEAFFFNNSFNLFYYPWHTYSSVEEFLQTSKTDVDFNKEVMDAQESPYQMAEVDVAQAAFYIQDEWQMASNFKLTAGLRVDKPIYMSEIAYDAEVAEFDGFVDTNGEAVTVDPSKFPDAKLLWSPRVGFNWDVNDDQRQQLRGGSGVFTGRIPFVWLGNQASNPSINPGYTFQVNATASDFNFPQVWKTNIAYDHDFGSGWFASVEGIYSKDLNAVVHRNYNMRKPTGKLQGNGQPVFQGDEANIYSNAKNFETFLDAGAIVLENVDEGYQYSLTGTVKKAFRSGLNVMAAYTFMESKDYTSIPAEIAADAFQRNPVVGDPNQSQFAHSRYGLRHRFITSINYGKVYGGGQWKTSVSLFGEVAKGNRYSYTYAGDANNDNIRFNDLIFVPASADQINLVDMKGVSAAEQWQALDQFIAQDDYLSSRRGQFAERNGAMLPWFAQFDLRILQDFNFNIGDRKNTLQLSLDVLNIGNMLNSNWGVRQLPYNVNPISVESVDATTTDGEYTATYTFNPATQNSFNDDVSLLSKWQAQVGLRWIF